MKLDAVTTVAGALFSAAGAALRIAAESAAAADGRTALPMLLIAGVCAIVGVFFFQAQEGDSAAFDITITLAAFLAGMAIGPAIGVYAINRIPDLDASYVAPFAPHMVGGLLVGACFVLGFRILWSNLKRLVSINWWEKGLALVRELRGKK